MCQSRELLTKSIFCFGVLHGWSFIYMAHNKYSIEGNVWPAPVYQEFLKADPCYQLITRLAFILGLLPHDRYNSETEIYKYIEQHKLVLMRKFTELFFTVHRFIG